MPKKKATNFYIMLISLWIKRWIYRDIDLIFWAELKYQNLSFQDADYEETFSATLRRVYVTGR